MSIEIKNASNFYSRFISIRYKEFYNQILLNLSRGIFITSYQTGIDGDFDKQMQAIIMAVLMGCPELFYVGQNVEYGYQDGRIIMTFPNNYPDDDFNELNDRMYQVINEVVEEANQLDNDFDKIMFVNEFLCKHITPQFELNEDNGNAYGALVKGVGRCEGYSEAGKLILDALGIESTICIGMVRYEDRMISHAWLAITYDGQIYGFDFAWNGSMTIQGIPGVVYTFLNQETISAEHQTDYYYDITDNDEYLFWNMHNGNADYVYELQNADVIPVSNGLFSVHHFTCMKFDAYQQDYELPDIVRDELSPLSKAQSFHFVYREDIDVMMVYYINF